MNKTLNNRQPEKKSASFKIGLTANYTIERCGEGQAWEESNGQTVWRGKPG